jgi:hypothetical protein
MDSLAARAGETGGLPSHEVDAGTPAGAASDARVAFYVDQPFHDAILRPVCSILRPQVNTIYTADRAEVVRFAPHVLVEASFADLAYFRRHLPLTVIGSVDHGLTPKGGPRRIGLHADEAGKRFDFICVSDDNMANAFRGAGVEPEEFWYTGYPQLDPLFRRDAPPVLGLDPAQPTVLFAPTWNAGFTAAPVLGKRVAQLIRGTGPRLNIIVKPHPHMAVRRGRWMGWWRDLAERDPGVLLVDDTSADVTPYLLAADVLVSDVSSVTFLYLALDRPVVLVTNPHHRFDPAYDPDDLNWRWRDLATEVTDTSKLAGAVADALAHPEARAETRQRYADSLFGPRRDGRNAQRIADKINEKIAGMGATVPYAITPRPAGRGLRARWRNRNHRLVRNEFYLRHVKGLTEDARLWVRMARARLRQLLGR